MKSVLLGLDLGGTNIKSVLLDARSLKIIVKRQIPTLAHLGSGAVVNILAGEIGYLLRVAGSKNIGVTAIGLGSAGLVHKGIVRNSPNLPGWQNAVPLERLLKKELPGLKIPLAIDNDANCFVLAETLCGAAKGSQNVVGLTLGTGVGGGLVLDGKLYRGSTGGAGELGHISIKYDGPRCLCGNWGCLEALVGACAIVERYRSRNSEFRIQNSEFSVAEISDQAKNGEPAAIKALAETGTLLGVGLANYVNVFNPQAVVIGGGVAQAGKYILDPAIKEMKRRAMPFNVLKIKVKTARLGPWAGAIGAALLNDQGVALK
ncbi:MAG: ROK family protein [Deltaproteobacteria bacterium]|nr:ROK family protein [Deltaproteobacteria bacterium]